MRGESVIRINLRSEDLGRAFLKDRKGSGTEPRARLPVVGWKVHSYLIRIENFAIGKDPQHVYRAIALYPVVPERIQRVLNPLRVGRVQFQRTVSRDMRSRVLLRICVLLHTEPAHARLDRK